MPSQWWESMKWIFKKDPLDIYMDQHEKQVRQQLAKKENPLDTRVIRRFDESHSPEAIERANQIFPNQIDFYTTRFEKIKKVYTRQPISEVFFFKYGSFALSTLTFGSCVYITNHMRNYLRLGHYARKIMYGSCCLFPSSIVCVIGQFLSNFQIPLRGEKCTSCVAMRMCACQVVFSMAWPMFMSSLMGFYYAQAYNTVPSVPTSFLFKKSHARHVANLIGSIYQRGNFQATLLGLFVVHLCAAYYVTQMQQETHIAMYKKILEREERIVQANRAAGVVESDIRNMN